MPLETIQIDLPDEVPFPEIPDGMDLFRYAFVNCVSLTNITFPTLPTVSTNNIIWKEECRATKSFIDMLHKMVSDL